MIHGTEAITVHFQHTTGIYNNEHDKRKTINYLLFRDNDRSSLNCASMLKGGWWWKSCGRGLNGLYLNDPQDLTARQGIHCT